MKTTQQKQRPVKVEPSKLSNKALEKIKSSEDIYIISAPSGTGKTTINRRLIAEIKTLDMSISHTTRKKRREEEHGDHYWFTATQEFNNIKNHNGMLEWANVFGNLYGTSYKELDRIISNNHKVLVEIDVQGWNTAKKELKHASSIFIMPPTTEELWKRLNSRGTDNEETIIKRFNTARRELEYSNKFHYFVINNDLDQAYTQIYNFITKSIPFNLSREEGLKHSQKLLESFKEKSKKL
jgi:guanylate kinase